ncbi:MAG TPA: lasso peptide biosynthesis B2 protein [Candidatus Sulfotelmatobacter sp.]
MKTARYASLVFRALCEITRYEVIVSLRGIGCILRQLRQQRVSQKPCTEELQRAICDAILLATCFYWKPVLCLQRSVCTVRLLRKYGIDARLAIGYRPSPFFSHAWVEVNGRVVYGSAAYQQRLQSLLTA